MGVFLIAFSFKDNSNNTKLKEIELNKVRLELEIDNMPADAKFRERKIQDMTMRLNALYESMYEIEEAIEEALLRKKAFEEEKMTLEKIRQILVTFDKVYDIMDGKWRTL